MCLYTGGGDLYKAPTSVEIIIYCLVCGIKNTFSTTYQREVKIKNSSVTTVIRYTRYIFGSKSFL